MATSDNVLRGGLTPKHIDVDETAAVLDPRPSAPVLTLGIVAATPGGTRADLGRAVDDFVLREVNYHGTVRACRSRGLSRGQPRGGRVRLPSPPSRTARTASSATPHWWSAPDQ